MNTPIVKKTQLRFDHSPSTTIERRGHPKEGSGFCSLCSNGCNEGVLIAREPSPYFYFLCTPCAKTIAKAVGT